MCFSAYSASSNENDISLIQFDVIAFNAYVTPIMLPTFPAESNLLDPSSCTVSGWGSTRGKVWNPLKLCKT